MFRLIAKKKYIYINIAVVKFSYSWKVLAQHHVVNHKTASNITVTRPELQQGDQDVAIGLIEEVLQVQCQTQNVHPHKNRKRQSR